MREERRRSSRQIEFFAYESEEDLRNEENELKVHMNVCKLVLVNKVNRDARNNEPDWYCFMAIVEGKTYYLDEKTFRRLLSCQFHS